MLASPLSRDGEVKLALVRNPLAHLQRLWLGRQGHEVTLNNVLGVHGIQPKWLLLWQIVRRQGVIWIGRRAVHGSA